MIEVLKKGYWSKADAFLLPLVGLVKSDKYEVKSYLFWENYNIHDYKLILAYDSEEYYPLVDYLQREVFPVLDQSGCLIENYDAEGRAIFVLDISEWAEDIDLFISGKYSAMSEKAIHRIEKYHLYNTNKVPVHIYAVLHPNEELKVLGNKSAISYVADEYQIDYIQLKKLGEVGSIYDRMAETLITNIEEFIED